MVVRLAGGPALRRELPCEAKLGDGLARSVPMETFPCGNGISDLAATLEREFRPAFADDLAKVAALESARPSHRFTAFLVLEKHWRAHAGIIGEDFECG